MATQILGILVLIFWFTNNKQCPDAGGLGYYAQLLSLSYISGLKAKGYYQLAAGYGTIGYEPEVNTFFGQPKSISTGGVAFDIPMINIIANQDGDAEKARQFTLQVGTLSSALEHITPEQMFAPTDPNAPKPDAISAVKALQKASAAGQKIYSITKENINEVLPFLKHDSESISEITRAVSAGKDVTTHTDKVSIPGGWSGFGYIITDPVLGDGVYKISGGMNGAQLIIAGMVFMILASLVVMSGVGVAVIQAAVLVAGIGASLIAAGVALIHGDLEACKLAISIASSLLITLIGFFATAGLGFSALAGGIGSNIYAAQYGSIVCK